MNVLPIITDSFWEIKDKSKKLKVVSNPVTSFVPAKGGILVKPLNEFNISEHHLSKKIKLIMNTPH